jgi:energy-coupling factor transporter ATP-binding protein EcfA2
VHWLRPAPSTRCPRDEKLPAISISRAGGADIRVEGLTWRPARRSTPVLRDLELSIAAGERLLVTGPSGAGKSTLLRAIAGLLLTNGQGDLHGSVTITGPPSSVVEPVRTTPSAAVGLLLQDPTTGVVAETVGRDVAFGLENRRVPRPQIWPRVAEALEAVQFPYGLHHPTAALSGGESQRLMLAGALALGPSVLLLDEPTSMLDPASAASVGGTLRAAITATACTTVIVEHHLEPWVDFADRLVVLGGDGQMVASGPPDEVLRRHADWLAAVGVWVPGMSAPQLLAIDSTLTRPQTPGPPELVGAEDVVVELSRRVGGRRTAVTRALDGVSASLRSGQALAVTGPSGAGKSTLTAVLAGLQRPTSGRVHVQSSFAPRRATELWRWRSRDLANHFAWVPQFPELGVVTSTVLAEVLATSRACGRDAREARRRALGLLEALSLSSLAHVSPYHLSGGEQRRLMVAAALVAGPGGVLLDEPTVGQDRATWAAVLGALRSARDAGAGIALSTHDEEAVSAVADGQVRLVAGRVVG